MKKEVSFFNDKRGSSADAFVEACRMVGMTDKEIKIAVLKQRAEDAYNKMLAARSIGDDAVSAAYNVYRDAYAEWYNASQGTL